ncbi:alpha/beta fold hydrolase, partial [Nonomuraea sp. RK-328]|nr:alpha/beta fold hydrolase [Nonomuraea sp. RK-328]
VRAEHDVLAFLPVQGEPYRRALLPLLDLGEPVVAIGHSMGAQVVTALAVEHPAAVSALVVIAPAYGADEEEERLIPGRLAALRTEGAAAALRQLGPLPRESAHYLARRACPVLAVHNVPEAAAWETSLPGWHPRSRTVVWPEAGHFLHLERPATFVDLVTSWLED